VRIRQISAVLLIGVGLAWLLMGRLTWTEEKTVLDIGPLQAKTQEQETIPLPPILGGLMLAGGVALLLWRPRPR
jgi:hypothetical protein